jgi:hypothetical protein
MFMIKIDWKFLDFPRKVPVDCELLSKEDRSILNKEFASKTDGMEFFHQLGILVQYLIQAPEKASMHHCTDNCLVYRTVMPSRGEIFAKTFSLKQANWNGCLHPQCLL